MNAQRQALSALRGLCISPEYRAIVVREGILDPLVLMSRSEDVEVLREVVTFLLMIYYLLFYSLYLISCLYSYF